MFDAQTWLRFLLLTAILPSCLGIPSTIVELCGSRLSIDSTTVIDNHTVPGSACETMPTEIGLLENLVNLDVFDKGYTGPVPTELGELALLTLLKVERNGFTGTLPSELGRLQRLTTLITTFNQLSGSVPPELGELAQLTYLSLTLNKFNGTIPAQIGKLQNLVIMDLEQNQFTGSLPSTVGELSALVEVDLYQNRFTGPFPIELTTLPMLEILFVQFNQFTGTLPSTLGDLSLLRELNTAVNRFHGHLPPELGKLQNLVYMDLEQNDFTGSLPSTFGELSSLRTLDVNRNRLSGSLPLELTKMSALELLFMQGNRFTGALPTTLGDLSSLKELVAHNNQLESTIPTEVGRLANLKYLTLQRNRLTGAVPSEIGNLVRLDGLSIEDNQLDGRIPSTFVSLVELTFLRLGTVLCDCDLLSFYSAFAAGLNVTNKFSVATCSDDNIYGGLSPHVLTSDSEAPCSHPDFLNRTSFGSKEAEVAWSYPFPSQVPNIPAPNFADSTWDDTQVPIGFEVIAPLFRNCSRAFRASSSVFAGENHFAFLVRWEDANNVVKRRCEFAKDLENGAEYSIVIPDLVPDSNYQVTILPIFVEFELYREPNYIFGPASKVFLLRTADDIPESAPLNLVATAREAGRIDLVWDPPIRANGELSYGIDCSCSQSGVSRRTSFSFIGLSPTTEYTFTVTPLTSVGPGPNASITVSTCQTNTRAGPETQDTCFAAPGFFLDYDQFTARPCSAFTAEIAFEACASLGSVIGVNTSGLVMNEGFWRTSETSSDFRACPIESACIGGLAGDLCDFNYTGPLCAVCETGFFFNGRVCDSCSSMSSTNYAIPLTVFTLLVLAILLGKLYAYRSETSLFKMIEPLEPKAKVLFTTYQIIGTFSWSLGVAFPQAFTEVLGALALVLLDLTEIFPAIRCGYDSDFFRELLIVVFIPLVFVLPAGLRMLHGKYRVRYGEDDAVASTNRSKWVLVATSYVFYTPVTNKVFRALRPCENFDTGESFLHEDYRIECSSPEYLSIFLLALFACAIYTASTPLWYFLMLRDQRHAIKREYRQWSLPGDEDLREGDQEKLTTIRTLYKSYRCELWWWEVFETGLKLVLTGLIALFAPGSLEQSIILMLAALVGTFFYQHFRPFRDPTDHFLGLASSYCIFLVAFISLLLKFSQEIDYLDPDFAAVASLVALLVPLVALVVIPILRYLPCTKNWCCVDRSERATGVANENVDSQVDAWDI